MNTTLTTRLTTRLTAAAASVVISLTLLSSVANLAGPAAEQAPQLAQASSAVVR